MKIGRRPQPRQDVPIVVGDVYRWKSTGGLYMLGKGARGSGFGWAWIDQCTGFIYPIAGEQISVMGELRQDYINSGEFIHEPDAEIR